MKERRAHLLRLGRTERLEDVSRHGDLLREGRDSPLARSGGSVEEVLGEFGEDVEFLAAGKVIIKSVDGESNV